MGGEGKKDKVRLKRDKNEKKSRWRWSEKDT